jgi:CRISPR/Cas system-associated endonuclease/helicase Cas3
MTKEEKKIYSKIYYQNNKSKLLKKQNEYRLNNLDKIKEYRDNNKSEINEYLKEYRKINPDKFSKYEKDRYNDKRKAQIKKYRTSEKGKLQYKKTRKITIYDKWRSVLHSSLRRLGKKKEGRTIDLLGYSAIELRNHITNLFTDGMTWDNHGEWHIDHIKSLDSFHINTPINIINALNNLQPLWATTREINGVIYEGNLNKGNK